MRFKLLTTRNAALLIMSVLLALCLAFGIFMTPDAARAATVEDGKRLVLDELDDFNTVDNGDGTFSIPSAKLYRAYDFDNGQYIVPSEVIQNNEEYYVDLFDKEGSLGNYISSVSDEYKGSYYVFNNGFSVKTLRTLLGKDADDNSTADELMCEIYSGNAEFVYDEIQITIPNEITSIGDGAFIIYLMIMEKGLYPLGFSNMSAYMLDVDYDIYPYLSGINESPDLAKVKIPSLTGTFSAETEGRTENIICKREVLGVCDITGLNLDGFKEVEGDLLIGEYYAESFDFYLGNTLEKIGGFLGFSFDENVTIPASLKYIGDYAFKQFSVIIPEDSNIEYIGKGAFSMCGLEGKLILPSSVKYIGESAFVNNNLTEVVLQEGVENIGQSTFYLNYGITSITLPASLKSISYDSFYFSSIKNINIADLDAWVSIDITNPSSSYFNPIDFSNININLNDEKVSGEIVISEDVTKIGNGVFYNYTGITGVSLPASVESIGACAFYNSSDIKYVKFPDKTLNGKVVGVDSNLTEIGKEAFYGLNKLTEFVIPETVTSIANGTAIYTGGTSGQDTGAFNGCEKLLVVYNLSNLNVHCGSKENGYAGNYALCVFDSYDGVSPFNTENDYVFLDAQSEVYLVDYIGEGGDIVLPASYNDSLRTGRRYSIAKRTFDGNDTITAVRINSNSVINIDESAFLNCVNIESVYIGAGIIGIGDSAFSGCSSLKTVTIVSGLEALGNNAFLDCSALAEITLQNSSLTSIGDAAFKNCTSLLSIVIPDTVIKVGNEAFYGCSSATDISIGKYVEEIGAYAFAYTSSLTSAVIPDSVTVLGTVKESNLDQDKLFGYSGIKSVYIGAGLTVLNNTFAYCENLTDVTFAENSSVVSLVQAFRGCNSIKKLVLPESVKTINGLFYAATSAPYEIHLSSDIDFLTNYEENSTYYQVALFTRNVNIEHLTIYLPEVTESNMETYGKNFAIAMLLTPYTGQDSSNAMEYENIVFVAPNEDAYKRILREMYDFGYNVAESPRVAYYSEWYSTAFLKTRTPGGASYRNKISNMSYNSNDIYAPQDRLFYLADVTYEVWGVSGELLEGASYTEKKLARTTPVDISAYITADNDLYDKVISSGYSSANGIFKFMAGADLRYVLEKDAATGAQYYVIDENYTLPSKVGIYSASGSWQLNEVNVTDVSKQVVNGKMTYVNVLTEGGSITVDVSEGFTAVYTGEAWTVPEAFKDIFEITKVDGNANKVATNAGAYDITLSAKDGYLFEGGENTVTVSLVIEPAEASVIWTWKGEDLLDDVVAEKFYDGVTISSELEMWFIGADGSKVIVPNEALQRYKNGELTNEGALDAGLWTLSINSGYIDRNYSSYVLVNIEKEFLIKGVTIGVTDLTDNLKIDLEGNSSLGGGLVYVYENAKGDIIPSYIQLGAGYNLKEVVNVQSAVARYVNSALKLEAVVSGSLNNFEIETENNAETDVGVYNTTFTVSAHKNYQFSVSGGFTDTAHGLRVTVSADGSTVTIVKTWYIVQFLNEFVNANATANDEASLPEYDMLNSGWTFGENVNITAPRLMHGDEDTSYATNSKVSFVLRYGETTVRFARSEFNYYINSAMPVGTYTLTAEVTEAFTLDAHKPWWNNSLPVIEQTTYPAFSREYVFEVRAAEITLSVEKNNGYAYYEWNYSLGNEQNFFNEFTKVIDGKVNYTSVNAENTYWSDYDYGTYSVTYNFARMYNEVYFDTNNREHLSLIKGGANGTYTVYFKIGMPNHNNLGGEGNADRYAYFFTVVVYETIDIPTVLDDGLVYTGNKVLPEIEESSLYEVIWTETDSYVSGGEHSVSFKLYDTVHYRWAEGNGDTVTVKFNVDKAENVFIVALNIIGWSFETFDAKVNNIRATSRYLDSGKNIVFKVVKEGETEALNGLSEFTVDENGMVNESVASKLNALTVGNYILYATVAGTNNYLPLEREILFTVDKAVNDWKTPFDVIGWAYKGYDKETNLILGSAEFGKVEFTVSKDGKAVEELESFTVTDGIVDDKIATALSALLAGEYTVTAHVVTDSNYTTVADGEVTLTIAKAGHVWEDAPSIMAWVKGEYDATENGVVLKDIFGNTALSENVDILIYDANLDENDIDDNAVYKVVNGEVLIDKLADAGVGHYILKVTVNETDNYYGSEKTFNFQIFAPEGLAWWAWLLIIVGILGVIALVFFILHEKGVLQMLTGKFVIAMRTKMTVDATIAAVRANLVAERSAKTRAEAQKRDKLEELRKAREEAKQRPADEQAAALEEQAALAAKKAEKMQKRAASMQKRADRMRAKAGEAEAEQEATATDETDSTEE